LSLGNTLGLATLSLGNTVEIPENPTLDLDHSLELLFRRRRWGSSGNWSGWMVNRWLRLRAATIGGSHTGTEAGATLIMFQSWIAPTLTAEAGHYSGGDAISRIRSLTNSPYLDATPLRSFNLDYQTAYLGLELNAGRVAISISVGLTRVQYSSPSFQGPFEVATFKQLDSTHDLRTAQIAPAAKLAVLIDL
jgi:hypothetical protein